MASSTHHQSAQHSRYSLSIPQNSRDEAVRLPSIKDLNFQYSRRHGSHDGSPHNLNPTIAPVDTSIHSQENSARWSRSNVQPQSPSPMPAHLQQHHHQHQHQHQHQQHTPPLSAGHEQPKNDYSSKPDNSGFLTPGMPLSAQSTPVPGSVTIGPGTRGDEAPQSKRRRSSGNMGAPRDARSPHAPYAPHYAGYPPSQPPLQSYHQVQAPMSHPGQPPLEHVHAQQLSVPTHPSYVGYPPQQYIPSRVHSHPPPQQQPPPTNPYPSPAPVPPPQSPWEQPHHPLPQHQHQPPPQHQPQPTSHLPPPQHPQHASHIMTQHQQPLPPSSQQHHLHTQPQQPIQAQQTIPPPLPHHTQHPQPQPQPHQAPPQIQQSQMPFQRTTAIVPIDTRGHFPVVEQDRIPSARDSTMSEIIKHCSALYNFASRYAQIQQSVPDVCPSPEELQEMSQRAVEVVRLLEEYRRLNLPESERVKMDTVITPPDDHRPPKRPWEDMSQDENIAAADAASFVEQQYPTPSDKVQSTAEQDMEIIRTKRATSTAGASGNTGKEVGQLLQGNVIHAISVKPPSGGAGPTAQGLCAMRADYVDYAKLQRKRDKLAGPNGEAPRIDMETLRASARAADLADKSHSRSKHSSRSQQSESISPMETGKPLPQQHHQGSFQLVAMMPPDASSSADSARAVPQQPQPQPHQTMQQQQPGSMAAPTPPWSTSVQPSAPAARGYAPEQLQHQSFMRTSHQTTNHTSPR
ncbi:hypothetical protein D9615_010134 [Tricholomella constricta]|uniref:Uncharacterized protein n=1 Tax=Tricholomella constricta TaxID=117010 RepID=A0A8H5GX94_9AGAR|nr:hypothetical protein D9615_010134 [Tricholomella constricta]